MDSARMDRGKKEGLRVIRFIALLLLLYVALPAQMRNADPRAQAHKPNIDIYLYRRSYTPEEKISLRLSGYNTSRVDFAVYRIDLAPLIRTSKTLRDMG